VNHTLVITENDDGTYEVKFSRLNGIAYEVITKHRVTADVAHEIANTFLGFNG
jgi:hypothetical protein